MVILKRAVLNILVFSWEMYLCLCEVNCFQDFCRFGIKHSSKTINLQRILFLFISGPFLLHHGYVREGMQFFPYEIIASQCLPFHLQSKCVCNTFETAFVLINNNNNQLQQRTIVFYVPNEFDHRLHVSHISRFLYLWKPIFLLASVHPSHCQEVKQNFQESRIKSSSGPRGPLLISQTISGKFNNL